MAELYDDRRQETRFATSGEGEVEIDGRKLRAELFDLSINGLRMSRPEGFGAPSGSRFAMTLLIPGADPFTAQVALVRVDASSVGVEFMDMSPRDFALLTALIERHASLRAQALMNADG
jgi:PilZ domain